MSKIATIPYSFTKGTVNPIRTQLANALLHWLFLKENFDCVAMAIGSGSIIIKKIFAFIRTGIHTIFSHWSRTEKIFIFDPGSYHSCAKCKNKLNLKNKFLKENFDCVAHSMVIGCRLYGSGFIIENIRFHHKYRGKVKY